VNRVNRDQPGSTWVSWAPAGWVRSSGRPWLGPDILDHLDALHARGVAKALLAPIGFVADHLEILWDLDVQAREKAAEIGLELERIESLNDDEAFVGALADLVKKASAAPARIGAE
jgi:protoporphyrin/coproporphyrin ferrochelatase